MPWNRACLCRRKLFLRLQLISLWRPLRALIAYLPAMIALLLPRLVSLLLPRLLRRMCLWPLKKVPLDQGLPRWSQLIMPSYGLLSHLWLPALMGYSLLCPVNSSLEKK